jgi:nitrile hydratase accessory protein
VFTWPEWAAALSNAIKRAPAGGDPSRGDTCYGHWLNALERLLVGKGATNPASLSRYRDAWDHAAHRTPHGQPIELKAEDSVLNCHCPERSDEAIPIRETPIDEIVEITVAAQGSPWSQSASTKAEANRMRAQDA